jgi:hypothetical protein
MGKAFTRGGGDATTFVGVEESRLPLLLIVDYLGTVLISCTKVLVDNL